MISSPLRALSYPSLKTLHRIEAGRSRGYWDPEVKIYLKTEAGSPSDAAETRLLFPSFDRFDATTTHDHARATTRHIRGVRKGTGNCVRARDLLALTRKGGLLLHPINAPFLGRPSAYRFGRFCLGHASQAWLAGWVFGHLPLAHTDTHPYLVRAAAAAGWHGWRPSFFNRDNVHSYFSSTPSHTTRHPVLIETSSLQTPLNPHRTSLDDTRNLTTDRPAFSDIHERDCTPHILARPRTPPNF